VDLPSGWDCVRLGAHFDFKNGFNATKAAYGAGLRFANILEVITRSHLRAEDVPGRVSISAALRDDFLVRRGDILFNRTSETQEEVALASVYVDDEEIIFGGFVIRARAKDASFDPVFAGYAFRSAAVRSQMMALGQGAIHANIGQEALATVTVARPPLPEQRAIVSALTDIDGLIRADEALIVKKQDIRSAAGHLLLTGSTRLPGSTAEWKEVAFGALAQPRKERIEPRRSGRQEFCIELEHLDQGTGRLLGSATLAENASMKSVFLPGDVLFGKLRSYLRKYWLADRPGVCSTEIWPLTANPKETTPPFLLQTVKTTGFVEAACQAYGTHMPRADWNVVRTYRLRVPGLPEQREIAAVLSDMDTEVDCLQARLAKTRDLKQAMVQELLSGRTRLV